jgi:lipoprotein-releasing system permease protein
VPYELFLARRYAFSKRRENFITIISILSIVGLAVGTAALIIVLSVFNGFSSVVTNIYVSFDPHVRISAPVDTTTASPLAQQGERVGGEEIANADSVIRMVKQIPEVTAAAAAVHGQAVLVHYTLPKVIDLTGISDSDARAVSGLAKSMQSGKLKLDSNSIVVGQILADALAVQLGDSLEVYSPSGLERILTEPVTPRMRKLIVTGIFAANNKDYDAVNAYTSPEAARDLFNIPANAATNIDVRLRDVRDANDVRDKIKKSIGAGYNVQSWYDLHTELYSVMQIERWVAYIILFLIVGVAAFSIFSSLTLTVFEKQRDIGLLRALGSPVVGIRKIYWFQGTLVGLLGTVTGCLIGLIVVVLQQQFGFFPLDTTVYIISALPVELRWQDFVSVGVGAMALTMLCSLFPSRRAAKVDPAVALRWE